jgi:mRNA interferase MazF
VRRGELWWADLPEPIGRRPVILLSRDPAYHVRARITVVPLTTRVRGLPVEVALGPQDGLSRACVANTDEITTVTVSRLAKRIGRLAPGKLRAVEDALRFGLAL